MNNPVRKVQVRSQDGIAAERLDDYVEVEVVKHVAVAAPVPHRNAAALLETRLKNWRNAVRMKRTEPNETCAFWAAQYVKARDDYQRQLAMKLEIIKPSNKLAATPDDVLDGFLVEAAVRALNNFEQIQLLRMRYVFNFPDNKIRAKLKIRDRALRFVHAKALNNLLEILDKLEQPVKIRAYNLHAGIVPCPQANAAVPLGIVASEQSYVDEMNQRLKALIDD